MPRGFAALTPEQRREIAVRGGKASQAQGTAHRWTAEEASAAGKKGGAVVAADRGHMVAIGKKGGEAVSRNRKHMAEIGSLGGQAKDRTKKEL